MKTIGHLVIYISEDEDFELWRFLAQLPSEERVDFIKSALNAALAQEGRHLKNSSGKNEFNNDSKYDVRKADNFIDTLVRKKIEFNELTETEEMEMIKLELDNHNNKKNEDLINYESDRLTKLEDNKLELIELEELVQPTQTTSNVPTGGLGFLLNNVIGEEDDENIIAFIKNNKSST